MITGDSLAHAKQLVDQGVASDGSFPLQPVVLAKSSTRFEIFATRNSITQFLTCGFVGIFPFCAPIAIPLVENKFPGL